MKLITYSYDKFDASSEPEIIEGGLLDLMAEAKRMGFENPRPWHYDPRNNNGRHEGGIDYDSIKTENFKYVCEIVF